MRTLPESDANLYDMSSRTHHVRVTIGGVDVTDLGGRDWLVGLSYSSRVDDPLTSLSLQLAREFYSLSLSPLNVASKLNRDGGPTGTFEPVIAESALVVVDVAVVPDGSPRSLADELSLWREVFRGRIDTWDAAGDTIRIECSDIAGDAAKSFIEHERAYAIARSPFGVDVWAPGKTVALGDWIVPSQLPEPGSEITPVYECAYAGTTGAAEPEWPLTAGLFADGTAQWGRTYFSSATWAALTAVALGDVVYDTASEHQYVCCQSGTTGASEPSWPSVVGQGIADGSALWARLPDNTDGGVAVEAILAGILADNCPDAPELYVPVSSNCWRNPFVVTQQSTLEALRSLAQEIGWDVRLAYVATASDHATWGRWRLMFYAPDRAKTTPDLTLSPSEWVSLPKLAGSVEAIRNVIEVSYSDPNDLLPDGNPKRKRVKVEDAASIAKYRRMYMGLVAGTSNNVNTTAEATALANAALSDLASPGADLEVDGPYRWNLEIGDLLRLIGNDSHFTANQTLAVVGISHDPTADRTVLACRGKPTIGVRRWLEWGAGPGVGSGPWYREPAGPIADSIAVTPSFRGAVVQFRPPVSLGRGKYGEPRDGDFASAELHISTTDGFEIGESTLFAKSSASTFAVDGLAAGTTYYGRIVCRDARGRAAPPSEQFEFTAEQIAAGDIESGVVPPAPVVGAAVLSAPDSIEESGSRVALDSAPVNGDGLWSSENNGFNLKGTCRVTGRVAVSSSHLAAGDLIRAAIYVAGSAALRGAWSPVATVGSARVGTADVFGVISAGSGSLTQLYLEWQSANSVTDLTAGTESCLEFVQLAPP